MIDDLNGWSHGRLSKHAMAFSVGWFVHSQRHTQGIGAPVMDPIELMIARLSLATRWLIAIVLGITGLSLLGVYIVMRAH